MSWKQGPLPPDTYNWGGVVPVGQPGGFGGFFFADFHGDHVKMQTAKHQRDGSYKYEEVRLEPHEVALYNNSLELPPNVTKRAKEIES